MSVIGTENQNANDLIVDVSDQTFVEKVIEESKKVPVVVDFWAPWCGPCKTLGPSLEKEARDRKGKVKIAKVNIDENQAVASQLRVQSIPAVFAFVDGKPVDGFMGAQSSSAVKEFLTKLITKYGGKNVDEDGFVEIGHERFNDKQFEDALYNFQKALEKEVNNPEVHSMIINCYLELGRIEEANLHLENLSSELTTKPEIIKVIAKLDILNKSEGLEDMETLRKRLKENPNDLKVKFELANVLNINSLTEEAIELLLEIYKADREWNEQAAKTQLTKIFTSLGHENSLSISGRRKLSSIMFA